MDFSSKIIDLEGDLRTLITRWDRFFGGDLRMPPIREKEILGRRLRKLTENSAGAQSGDRFRLSQLQHRFMSYSMNWERLLREREEGVRRFVPGGRSEAVASVSGAGPATTNAVSSASVDKVDVEDLFDNWCAVKMKIGQEIKIGRQAFEDQIDRQRKEIEAKMGSKVTFEVSVADGKVKLTARRKERNDNKE